MIEFASQSRMDEIKALWKEAFGDTDEAVNYYFENMHSDENMVIYIENGEVAAMASMLPVSCKTYEGRYIYAVATAKKFRGRGFCKAVMSCIHSFMADNGEDFAILVPAEKSLFDFYGKMGYSEQILKPQMPKVSESGNVCPPGEYYKIRQEIFAGFDLIEWSEKDLEHILSVGSAREIEGGAAYFEGGRAVEVLSREIFKNEWTEPFALIKYVNKDVKFERPYFGLPMN